MKVKVKDTGEIVEVTPCSEPMNVRLAFYETEQGRKFPMFALEFEKEVDWEQRRYEIAKECIAALMHIEITLEDAAKISVEQADALIAELKKESAESQNIQETQKKEVYLGDIIEVNGEKYICKEAHEDQDCSCCDLCIDDDCKRPYGNCSSDYRKDGKDLLFKKIGGTK